MMEHKKSDLRELRFKDITKEMDHVDGVSPENEQPDHSHYSGTDDLLFKCSLNKNQIFEEQEKMISGIEASPLASRFMDSRAACRVFDADDCEWIGNFMSFQFDAGAGFLMDFSLLEYYWDFPLEWKGDLPWDDGRIGIILEAFERIRPGMKDGMLIDYHNIDRWSGFAVDLFPLAFYDRKYYYQLDRFIPKYAPNLLDTPYDEYHFASLRDFYWQKWPGVAAAYCEDGDFDVSRAGYPYAECYFAVSFGLIRVLFPWEPTPEDLAWMAGIKRELETLREAVKVMDHSYFDGPRLVYDLRYHFVIFPDKKN